MQGRREISSGAHGGLPIHHTGPGGSWAGAPSEGVPGILGQGAAFRSGRGKRLIAGSAKR